MAAKRAYQCEVPPPRPRPSSVRPMARPLGRPAHARAAIAMRCPEVQQRGPAPLQRLARPPCRPAHAPQRRFRAVSSGRAGAYAAPRARPAVAGAARLSRAARRGTIDAGQPGLRAGGGGSPSATHGGPTCRSRLATQGGRARTSVRAQVGDDAALAGPTLQSTRAAAKQVGPHSDVDSHMAPSRTT